MLKNINDFASNDENLFRRTARGGFWVFFLRISHQLLQIIKIIILARLLNPKDFGLMGISLLAIAGLETFSKTGFHNALVQKKGDIRNYLDTAWTFSIIRGFILFITLYIAAPFVAIFFKAPEAKFIIQIMGAAVIFEAFTNIGVIHFQKELEFNKQFIYKLSGTLVDFVISIWLGLLLRNAWALAYGWLAGHLTRFIVSYLIHSYRPRFALDLKKAKELFGFGKWILGSTMLTFLVTQGDDIFVGRFLGVAMLGFYQLAYRIANIPATEITHVISQVAFPAYSKMQDNINRLKEAYLKVFQVTAFLSFFVTGIIVAAAPYFTVIFLGKRWLPIVPAMRLLVIAGLCSSLAATMSMVFSAVGRPEIDTKIQAVRLLILIILIYPFTGQWGILGASGAVLLSIFLPTIAFSVIALKVTKCKIKAFGKAVILPFIAAAIMVLVMFFLTGNIDKTKAAGFSLFILIGVLVYFSAIFLFDKFLRYKMYSLIKRYLREMCQAAE